MKFFSSVFQPLGPRHAISHHWVILIVRSSKSLDSTLDLGDRSNALSRYPQTTLHSTALLSEWERLRGRAKL